MRALGSRRSAWLAFAGLAIVAALLVTAGQVPARGAAPTPLATFTAPGAHIWAVPAGVTSLTFTVYGASGGDATSADGRTLIAAGGAGAAAKGTFAVRPGQRLYLIVGGHGNANAGSQGGAGQQNGRGGAGGSDSTGSLLGGGSGGGFSSVATGYIGKNCFMNQPCSDGDRFIVAGGGGGAGSASGLTGGNAGGLQGSPGGGVFASNGEGGSQFTGGIGSTSASYGQFGFGGPGAPAAASWGSEPGGGGGGFYGGGADFGAGGGGGSSHISGFAVKGLLMTVMHYGDGKIVITAP